MKKVVFCFLASFFILLAAGSFVEPATHRFKTPNSLSAGNQFGVLYWYFDNTFVGYFQGCRIYATGLITMRDDGSYTLSPDFSFRAECTFHRISATAVVNAERTEVISSLYINTDEEPSQELTADESREMDGVVLTMVQNLK